MWSKRTDNQCLCWTGKEKYWFWCFTAYIQQRAGSGRRNISADSGDRSNWKGYDTDRRRILSGRLCEGKITETELKFAPIESKSGIKLASFNFYTVNEDQAVMWRGPIISSTLSQIYQEVEWGELDYLLIDMPPGTGDTAITVMQSFRLDGIIAVGTPQKMVTVIVKKLINMAQVMNIPVIGVVENLAHIIASNGEKLNVWGKENAIWHANELSTPLLAELPIDHEMGEAMENGNFEDYILKDTKTNGLVEKFLESIK